VQAGPEGGSHLAVFIQYLLLTGDQAVHAAAGQVLNWVVGRQRTEELMRSYGEELMEKGRQEGLARGLAQGVTRGRAEYILRILTARGVHLDEQARQRILTCTDVATLDRWFDKSLNATTLADVLDALAQ
jgi:hypothetical protein